LERESPFSTVTDSGPSADGSVVVAVGGSVVVAVPYVVVVAPYVVVVAPYVVVVAPYVVEVVVPVSSTGVEVVVVVNIPVVVVWTTIGSSLELPQATETTDKSRIGASRRRMAGA